MLKIMILGANRGYWELKVEITYLNLWSTRFGGGCGNR